HWPIRSGAISYSRRAGSSQARRRAAATRARTEVRGGASAGDADTSRSAPDHRARRYNRATGDRYCRGACGAHCGGPELGDDTSQQWDGRDAVYPALYRHVDAGTKIDNSTGAITVGAGQTGGKIKVQAAKQDGTSKAAFVLFSAVPGKFSSTAAIHISTR